MDAAWALDVKSGSAFSLATRKRISPSRALGRSEAAAAGGITGIAKISVWSRWRGSASSMKCRPIEVRAAGKKRNKHENSSSSGRNDHSNSEKDDSEEMETPCDNAKSGNSTNKPHHTLSNWREVRAALVEEEKKRLAGSNVPGAEPTSDEPFRSLGLKWAHPITLPETGCVLVATDKLDGVRSFERTVVLLLRQGSSDPREGPFGVIINRPLLRKIRQMQHANPILENTFADCSLHFGGPLDASMFLLNTSEDSPDLGFDQVVPGICYGARNSLEEVAALVKEGAVRPQDFRFFVGYAGWQLDQLKEEIESDYWVVASCSTNLISGASASEASNLWEEILQLMGGQYLELSRKPKQDTF